MYRSLPPLKKIFMFKYINISTKAENILLVKLKEWLQCNNIYNLQVT